MAAESTANAPIRITHPHGFVPERRYALSLLFEHLLGLSVELAEGEPGHYVVSLPSGKWLRIRDAFFGHANPAKSACDEAHLPGERTILSRAAGPVPFGAEGLTQTEAGFTLEADLVGSAFLLATAWEEEALARRPGLHDHHGRLRPSATWAGRLGMTDRPLVHEWAEVLKGLLTQLGYALPPPRWQYAVQPTHDLDTPLFYSSRLKRLAVALGRPFGLWHRYVERAPNPLAALESGDPYATTDTLMDAAEGAGARAVFFLTGTNRSGPYDQPLALEGRYLQRVLKRIVARGHRLGLHPAYRSSEQPLYWHREWQRLTRAADAPVDWIRPHFLRGTLQSVWLRCAALGVSHSSSAAYADRMGFRTGLCVPYPVFSLALRQVLPVTEWPVALMDVAPFERRPELGRVNPTPEVLLPQLERIRHLVVRSRGCFTFDWHNSTLETPAWRPYRGLWQACYQR